MLYHLFEYLDKHFDVIGSGVFRYISFRAGMAIVTSLVIAMLFGKSFIRFLQKKQIGESIRDLGLHGQMEKKGTPTMGGVIILTCILIPTLLFARPENVYVLLMVVSTIWMGIIGFIDDYIKVFRKNKEGLAGKFKVVGQVGLGVIVGSTLFFNQYVVVREYHHSGDMVYNVTTEDPSELYYFTATGEHGEFINRNVEHADVKSTITTIPFLKNNEFDYGVICEWLGLEGQAAKWFTALLYIGVCIFIVTAVSNGANITDGIDGLAAGTSAIIGLVLAILAYVSGNTIFADYLNIMYLPHTGELVICCGAFVGACIGFLWHNSYPARVFMGDTGSLAIGGVIAVIALAIRKELLIPILCGVFLIELLSVICQVSYFKYTKKKYGEGRRILLMSPLHHHYQKKEMHEAKIVARFWIVGIILAVLTLATLKLR